MQPAFSGSLGFQECFYGVVFKELACIAFACLLHALSINAFTTELSGKTFARTGTFQGRQEKAGGPGIFARYWKADSNAKPSLRQQHACGEGVWSTQPYTAHGSNNRHAWQTGPLSARQQERFNCNY